VFFVSQYQVDKVSKAEMGLELPCGYCNMTTDNPQMRNHRRENDNAYILARVYGMGGQRPGVQWFLDPWDHPQLEFDGPENGQYRVRIM
jgi:hypothetical protein